MRSKWEKIEPVALLYQRTSAPVINRVRKPMKKGGYTDSGADIAFNLRVMGIEIVTPVPNPDPTRELDWLFPDTLEGIEMALRKGAKILWANTMVFSGHPLERCDLSGISIVGQRIPHVHRFDDKRETQKVLSDAGLPTPPILIIAKQTTEHALGIDELTSARLASAGIGFPIALKPVRGRGSEGVTIVSDWAELRAHARRLLTESVEYLGNSYLTYGSELILEKFMTGDELTVTVLPPGKYLINGPQEEYLQHWALSPVTRKNHVNGVASHRNDVPEESRSRALREEELKAPSVINLMRHCEIAAAIVGAVAPIRIDSRADEKGIFRLFDVNMKPNMTGIGRPNREDAESLTGIAAATIGWSYQDLLYHMLKGPWDGALISKPLKAAI